MRGLKEGVFRLLVASAVALPALASATNGFFQIGYGVKSKGMGGVGIAYPQDSFASAMNPAGMTLLGFRGDIGVHWLRSDGRFHQESVDPQILQGFSTSEDVWWPEAGIVWMAGSDQSLGLSFYSLGSWRVDANHGLEGTGKISSDWEVWAITPSWAWQINCIHSIGIAPSAVGARFKFDGDGFVNRDLSVDPTRVSNNGNNWEWGVNVRFGWFGQICDCFALGVTYKTKTWMSHFRKYEGLIPGRGNADLPPEFGVGATWRALCPLLVSAEAVKIFWREGRWFKNTNLNDADLFGTNEGPGLGWNEQLVLKIGAAYDFSDRLVFRIGYNYGNTPLPEGNRLNVLSMVTTEHHFTVGGTIYMGRCGENELSVNYVHGFENDVRGQTPGNINEELKFRSRQNSIGVSYGRVF